MAEAISSHIVDLFDIENGLVVQSRFNSVAIGKLGALFRSELEKSLFYATVVAFVSDFPSQFEPFKIMYSAMGDDLPEPILSEEDSALLSDQAGVAVESMERHVSKISLDLQNFLARSIGGVQASTFIQGVNGIVRKMGGVEQIAREHLILWFRLLGHLVYKGAEERGYVFGYHYVGSIDDSSREFCSELSGHATFSREEIASMDNGQVPGVFVNGGGYGCSHFWLGELL